MLVRLSHVKLQTILSRTSSFTHVSPLISRNRLQNVAKFIQPNPLIGKRLVNRSFSTTTEESDLEDKNKGKKSKKSEVEEPQIEDIYQKKTPIEHVLLRPDTYIGTTQATTEHYWVVEKSESGVQIVKREITFVPGLYKIFDEILVNASDNRQRDPVNMNEIQVEINPKKGKISIWNNGKGIPIQLHKKEGLYIPELVLGQLLTGSNFNDSIAKVTGGRNGYGAKLTNIFSTEFEVETVDIKQGLKYKQKWTNNMGNKTEPLITPVHLSGKKPSTPESEEVTGDYTKVSFKPDLSKFGMSTLEEGDILKLMERRVYDVAGCNNRVTVTLNGNKLPNTFEEYLSLYVDPDIEFDDSINNNNNNDSKRYFSRINERWQVGVGISHSGHFSQVSFVNSICTSKGGTHVNYIADQVVKYIIDQLKSQNKDMKLNPNHIKHHLDVYVNCLVENPSFDSQTKETLTTKISNFGSTCHLSKSFLQEFINRTNILEHITNWAKAKEQNELITHTRSRSVVGIPKLYDANWAGTEKGNECTLILTEGDSAKALAVSGLSSLGRDKYGVFPLKGKLLNVRDATAKQLMENAEINHLVTILGLNYDKQYDSPEQKSELRYGKVMLMTDQDHDGSHIKGLFINFINTFWPSLLVNGNFLEEFITPIVKASKGKNKLTFFTIPEYEQWKQSLTPEESKGYTIKYYKGLGTNTSAEAKEYFGNLEKHRIEFAWNPESQESIELAFKKDQTEERKTWLSNFKEGTHVDHSIKKLTIQDFIHKELILFSRADNIRSIPNVIDGLKPGQRKVLFACFKRNLKNEIKVAQLAGYVSEQTAYHHGEVSLHSTIINMAQDFVGSNNLPILFPSGQFGSRLQGGKDAASARYLFTRLQSYTRKLFPEVDDDLLNYLDDDGQQIQPEKYVPIIPTILINGCEGLGTGWSTKVPMYNPIEIIDNLINKIEGKEMKDLFPFARGFQGTIEKKGENGFITRGILQEIDNTTLVIKELPLNTWIDPYKEYLDELVRPPHGAKPIIKNYTMQHTDGSVKFVIKLTKPMMERLKLIGPIKKLKLESLLNTSNMILFDANNNIKKYHSPLEIIDDFYAVRLEFYEKRKSYLTEKLQKETEKLQNRARFCTLVANGEIKVGNRSKQDLLTELENLNFTKKFEPTANDYDYLLSTALWNLTHERIQVLLNEKAKKEIELEALKKSTALDIWKTELTDLRNDLVHDFPAFLKHQYHHL